MEKAQQERHPSCYEAASDPVSISSPVRWGTDGLAFIGLTADLTAGQFSVYLIHGSFVAP
jgi:hypothetical protein